MLGRRRVAAGRYELGSPTTGASTSCEEVQTNRADEEQHDDETRSKRDDQLSLSADSPVLSLSEYLEHIEDLGASSTSPPPPLGPPSVLGSSTKSKRKASDGATSDQLARSMRRRTNTAVSSLSVSSRSDDNKDDDSESLLLRSRYPSSAGGGAMDQTICQGSLPFSPLFPTTDIYNAGYYGSPSKINGGRGSVTNHHLYASLPASFNKLPMSAGATFDLSIVSPPTSSTYLLPDQAGSNDADPFRDLSGILMQDFPLSAPADFSFSQSLPNAFFAPSFSTPPKPATATIVGLASHATSPAYATNADDSNIDQSADLTVTHDGHPQRTKSTEGDEALALFASQVRRQTEALSLSDTGDKVVQPSSLATSCRLPPLPEPLPFEIGASSLLDGPAPFSSPSNLFGNVDFPMIDWDAAGNDLAADTEGAAPGTELATSAANEVESTPKAKKTYAPKRPHDRPPRPPNCFMLYRSDALKQIKAEHANKKMPQSELSQLVGDRWRAESEAVKAEYERKADEAKAQHAIMYPDYRYTPTRKTPFAQGRKGSPHTLLEKEARQADNVNAIPYYNRSNKKDALSRSAPARSSTKPSNVIKKDASKAPIPVLPPLPPGIDNSVHSRQSSGNDIVSDDGDSIPVPKFDQDVFLVDAQSEEPEYENPPSPSQSRPVRVVKKAVKKAVKQGPSTRSKKADSASLKPSRPSSRSSESSAKIATASRSRQSSAKPTAKWITEAKSRASTAAPSTVPRYQQPTSASMARSVTLPPNAATPLRTPSRVTNKVLSRSTTASGRATPLPMVQAVNYGHVLQPVPQLPMQEHSIQQLVQDRPDTSEGILVLTDAMPVQQQQLGYVQVPCNTIGADGVMQDHPVPVMYELVPISVPFGQPPVQPDSIAAGGHYVYVPAVPDQGHNWTAPQHPGDAGLVSQTIVAPSIDMGMVPIMVPAPTFAYSQPMLAPNVLYAATPGPIMLAPAGNPQIAPDQPQIIDQRGTQSMLHPGAGYVLDENGLPCSVPSMYQPMSVFHQPSSHQADRQHPYEGQSHTGSTSGDHPGLIWVTQEPDGSFTTIHPGALEGKPCGTVTSDDPQAEMTASQAPSAYAFPSLSGAADAGYLFPTPAEIMSA